MPEILARMYGSPQTADAAAKDLLDHGFSGESVHVVAPPPPAPFEDGAPPAPDTSYDAVLKTGVPAAHAAVYADGVRRGEALVVVHPLFGYARAATEILDSHDPLAVTLPAAAPAATASSKVGKIGSTSVDWSSAAPLSSWLGWRVLLDDPAPLSNYFKWRTVKTEPTSTSTLNSVRKQSADAAPLSRSIGMPLLSDNPAPLSSMAGWTVLSSKSSPLSEKAGWSVLADDPAPLSAKIGWRVLLQSPTPLSSLLGLPVLSKRS